VTKAAVQSVPAWVDKATLMREICLSDTSVDDWVRHGELPAPVKRRGKLMWEWAEVHDWLKHGNPATRELSEEEQVQRGTLLAMQQRRSA
jgi:hypothetical protein